jgi:hypothetical protein
VVQAADFGQLYEVAHARGLDRPRLWIRNAERSVRRRLTRMANIAEMMHEIGLAGRAGYFPHPATERGDHAALR